MKTIHRMFLILFLLSTHIPGAFAKFQINDDAVFVGRAKNAGYSVVSAITFEKTISALPPFTETLTVGGLVTIKNLSKNQDVDCKVKAELTAGTGQVIIFRGALVCPGANGKTVRLGLGGYFDDDTNQVVTEISLTSRMKLTVKAKKFGAPDIAGTWNFLDDPAGPMTISFSNGVGSYQGIYKGTGAHSNLVGTLTGKVKLKASGETTWSGAFVIKELANKVAGTFICSYAYTTLSRLDCQFAGGSSAKFSLQEQ